MLFLCNFSYAERQQGLPSSAILTHSSSFLSVSKMPARRSTASFTAASPRVLEQPYCSTIPHRNQYVLKQFKKEDRPKSILFRTKHYFKNCFTARLPNSITKRIETAIISAIRIYHPEKLRLCKYMTALAKSAKPIRLPEKLHLKAVLISPRPLYAIFLKME